IRALVRAVGDSSRAAKNPGISNSARVCFVVVATCLALGTGACDAQFNATGSEQKPITGGTADSGDPAVVALVDLLGIEHCSGTLIAPSAILTAGHCDDGLLHKAVFGATADASRRITIAGAIRHPMYAGEGHGYDVAIMHLGTPVLDIATVPVADRPLPSNAV